LKATAADEQDINSQGRRSLFSREKWDGGGEGVGGSSVTSGAGASV